MKLAPLAACLALLLPIVAQPVVAQVVEECESDGVRYNCVTQEVVLREVEPAYDNGLNGTLDSENVTPIHETWPDSIGGEDIPDGVIVEPYFEAYARAFASLNGTAAPNASVQASYVNETGGRVNATGLVRVLAFNVNMSPNVIMNGASEFYYRSPLRWVASNYSAHFLEIYDEDGRLVAGKRYPSVAGDDARLYEDRVYYRVSAMFESGKNHTFVEYVNTTGTPQLGMPDVELYLAPGQDVDNDGHRVTRVFPSYDVERVLSDEVAYSFRFVYGMGPGGTMNLLKAKDDTLGFLVNTSDVPVKNVTGAATAIDVVIPIRTTTPVYGSVWVTGNGWDTDTYTFENVTGTLHFQLTLYGTIDAAEVDPRASVVLEMFFEDTAACPVGALAGCAFVSYPMYANDTKVGQQSAHTVERLAADATNDHSMPHEWAPWVEVRMMDGSNTNLSPTESKDLTSLGFILAGVLLFAAAIVTAPVSVPIMVGLTVAGFVLVTAGAISMSPELRETLARAAAAGATIAAAAACGGMFLAPGAYKLLAAAACALLGAAVSGNLPTLLRFLLELPEIIKAAVEKLGEVLSDIAYWAFVVMIVVGLFLLPYVFFIPLKYGLLMVLAPVAMLMGYDRATKWDVFRRVYHWYMFGWSELVENRLLKMGVKA